jgi:hypothetical protein
MLGAGCRSRWMVALVSLAGAGCAVDAPAAAPARVPVIAAAGARPAPAARPREPSATERVALEAAFARADLNGDGRLSREEAVHLPAIEARFDELDTDHDGFLSFEEFMVGALAVD